MPFLKATADKSKTLRGRLTHDVFTHQMGRDPVSPPLQLNCLSNWKKTALAVAVDGTGTLQRGLISHMYPAQGETGW